MTELSRLLAGEADEVERKLLESASGDNPSTDARQKTLTALGLAGSVSLSATASNAANGSHAAPASGTTWGAYGGAKAGGVAVSALVKWFGLGAIGAAVALGGALVLGRSSAPPPATPAEAGRDLRAPAPEAAGRRPAAPAAREGHTEPPRRRSALTPERPSARPEGPVTLERALPERREHGSGGIGGARGANGVLEQVASLDEARAALRAGDPQGALAQLDRHQRRFRGGMLAPEATVLRIRAMLSLGKVVRARELGEQFLAENPNSPHARRVKKLIGKSR